MNLRCVAFAAAAGLALAGCAGLPSRETSPLLELADKTFYLHPARSNDSQVEAIVSVGLIGTLSRDIDEHGKCRTSACREKWQAALGDSALAYSRLGLHLLSVAYYRQALLNAADEADVRINLAIELDYVGNTSAAQKEFDTALEISKNNGDDIQTEEILGRFYLLTDRLDLARTSFEKCVRIGQPADKVQYCAICLALTKWRGGYDSMLLPLTTAGKWPGPLLALVRGQIDERALAQGIAADADASRRRNELCEALYYAGEMHLQRGDRPLALRYFRAAVGLRVESFWETGAAQRRIEQLHGNDDPPAPMAPASHIPVA